MKYVFAISIYITILFSISYWFRAQTPIDEVLPVLTSPVVVVGTGTLYGECMTKLEDGDGNFFTVLDNSLCNVRSGQIIKR